MTDQPHELLAEIIDAHGGELVGRIRLQKVIYLLDQLGLASGFEYSYHHYGPYSSEVSSALLDAESAGVVQDQIKFRQSDGASYSVFHSQLDRQPEKVGDLDRPAAIALLGRSAWIGLLRISDSVCLPASRPACWELAAGW